MSDLFNKITSRSPMMYAVLLLAVGLIMVIWPGTALSLAVTVLAIGLLLVGAANLLNWVRNRGSLAPSDAIVGGVLAVIGLVLLFNPGILVRNLSKIGGVFVIVVGVSYLLKALDVKKAGGGNAALVTAILTIVAGLFIFANPAFIAKNIVRIIGLVLIYNGASTLFIAARSR